MQDQYLTFDSSIFDTPKMIHSTTDILSDIISIKSKTLTTRSAISDSDDDDEINEKEKLFTRHNFIHAYFLRMSTKHKMAYLEDILERVNNRDSLRLLINTFYAVFDKLFGYGKVLLETKYNRDVLLQDHDRMLDESSLTDIIETDLQWFETLTDQDQIVLFISLYRNCDGAVMREIYMKLLRIYHRRKLNVSSLEFPIVDEDLGQKDPTKSQKEIDYDSKLAHDAESPVYQEYLKRKSVYDDAIAKYKKELGIFEKKHKPKPAKKNKDKKKSSKKSSTKSKKSKKSKHKKKKETSIDWVQFLPVWVIKKILGYLDKKSLGNLKKVNAYYNWVIGDFTKDLKIQKVLEKNIQKLRDDFSLAPTFDVEEAPRVSFSEKRLKNLSKRGAILEKMRHTRSPLDTHCLLLSAIRHQPMDYIEPIGEATVFPRVQKASVRIYKRPDHIVKDVNLIYETSVSCEDIKSPLMEFTLATHTKTSVKDDVSLEITL